MKTSVAISKKFKIDMCVQIKFEEDLCATAFENLIWGKEEVIVGINLLETNRSKIALTDIMHDFLGEENILRVRSNLGILFFDTRFLNMPQFLKFLAQKKEVRLGENVSLDELD